MKLVAIECKCGHVQTTNLPNSPRPDMLGVCQVCGNVAQGVWQPEIQTATWMKKEETR